MTAPDAARLPRWLAGLLGRALPLRAWLAISHGVVLLLPATAVLMTGALAWSLRVQTATDAEHQAVIVASFVGEALDAGPEDEPPGVLPALDDRLRAIRARTLAGFRVLDRRGVVVASSGLGRGQDLSAMPEVEAVLRGATTSVRPDPDTPSGPIPRRVQRSALSVAVPVVVEDRVVGVVVVSRTPLQEAQALFFLAPRLWWGVLLAVLGSLGMGLLAGHAFSRNLKRMARSSRRIADGTIGVDELIALPGRSHVRETRELAHAIASMARRLQDRLGYIREFAGNVSHEFKTPLATLKGTIELLADEPEMSAEQRARFLANAEEEVDRMGRLVSGLLALARAEERADHGEIDLDELIAQVRERCAGEVHVESEAGTLHGDASQLGLALDNLVENALRYGGAQVEVRIVAQDRGDEVLLDVIDDGPGISEANLPRVTERFFTTDRDGGGTGLGLALVEAVCRAHGGRLEVQSAPGHTRMRMVLSR